MAFVLIESGEITRKQPNPEDGLIEAPDWVVCGMVADGEGGYVEPPPEARAPTVDDFHSWLYEHLDSLAQADKWDNRVTLMQRAAYPGIWQELALSFCAHVDLCEGAALQYLQSGQPLPESKDAFIGMLPEWVKP